MDLRLRWLWMQASPAAVLAVVQGAARGGSGRGGQAGVGDSLEHLDGRALDGQSVRLVSQPARDPSAARWCIWAPQAARMVAERLQVQAKLEGVRRKLATGTSAGWSLCGG